MENKIELSVGEVSKRSGIAISTLHFYEELGLIMSNRNRSNHETKFFDAWFCIDWISAT